MLEEILSLPLEQKIGQLFIIGLPGTELDAEARELLDEIKPGGVCLFARNVREAAAVRNLLDDIRAALPVTPFLSVDQEGGTVDRLRRILEPMPAAAALRRAEDAERLGRITAEALRRLGFNMNFAPVVDVIDEARGRFQNGLVSRGLGLTKEATAEFAGRYLNALQAGGILGSIKHFPGLGAAQIDSHEELPVIRPAAGEFESVDLFPYRAMLAAGGVRAVMVAHVAFPGHDLQETDGDGKLLPTSLSFNFTTRLLREQLGFQGLALTDDLEMGAIVRHYGLGQACRMAVAAGQDQLLICNRPDAIREGFRAMLAAARSGALDEPRLALSLQRIAAVKNLIRPPLEFDAARWAGLSDEISDLKASLK